MLTIPMKLIARPARNTPIEFAMAQFMLFSEPREALISEVYVCWNAESSTTSIAVSSIVSMANAEIAKISVLENPKMTMVIPIIINNPVRGFLKPFL